jgi:two-component system alkaline phosphatase synthesis response regulator PhoP
MAKKVLIVEDDPGISLGLKDEFESEGYDVWAAVDGEQGLEAAKNQKPDLIILDIMLPVLDGYEVCRRLRMEGNRTPIIMLTVKDKEIDKILGLELGADDYVTKPFSLRELLARAKAIFRRTEAQVEDLGAYSFGETELDFKKYEATKRGESLELTPLEFHLLKLMIQRKGEVLTRDDFLDGIWGANNLSVTDRTVDSHIANIRKKLEDDPARPRHIVSVRGVGYKFVD